MSRKGIYPSVPAAPFIPGLEVAGIVKAFGPGVDAYKVGDTVAAITPGGGGYATHALVPAAMAIPLPAGFDPATAVALLVQGITAEILLSQAGVKQGDTVLISAAGGGLGNIAVQLAKARGAHVIGLTSENKLAAVRNLGADQAINYENAEWTSALKETLPSEGISVYLDSIGDLGTGVLAMLAKQAQWIIFGFRSNGQNALPPEALYTLVEKNITVRGFNLEGWLNLIPDALSALFAAVAAGTLKVQTTKFPLSEAARAHELLESRGTSGKLVLIP